MRKSILALTAAGGVFALTAAAASTLTVDGPFNPRAGAADPRECELGEMSFTTQDDGSLIQGVTLASASDPSAECLGKTVWIRLAYNTNVWDEDEGGSWVATEDIVYGKALVAGTLDDPGEVFVFGASLKDSTALDAAAVAAPTLQTAEISNAQVLVTEDSGSVPTNAAWATVVNSGHGTL